MSIEATRLPDWLAEQIKSDKVSLKFSSSTVAATISVAGQLVSGTARISEPRAIALSKSSYAYIAGLAIGIANGDQRYNPYLAIHDAIFEAFGHAIRESLRTG